MGTNNSRLIFIVAVTAAVCVIVLARSQSKQHQADYFPGEQRPIDVPSSVENTTETFQTNTKPRVFLKEKVATGINLIPYSGSDKIVLSNLSGDIINQWEIDAARARLLPECKLLVIHGSKLGLRKRKWRELKPHLRLYSRSGEILWEYTQNKTIHHDVHMLSDNALVFLQVELIDFPTGHPLLPYGNKKAKIRSDSIQIVGLDKKVQWQWFAHDHLDLQNCGWNGCEKKTLRERDKTLQWDWSHINTVSQLPENRHATTGDDRFAPGNFLVVPRNFWTAYILEFPSGQVVWQYGESLKREDQLIRGHEAQMIPSGLPGAGNILLFDNGLEGVREYSRIREIDPITKQIVWSYEDRSGFFSVGGGSVQRLENGNTLISEDVAGRLFEVDSDGKLVWEVLAGTRISRARRYPESFCEKEGT